MSKAETYALISVDDVTIVENLAPALVKCGIKILATEGTYKKLKNIKIDATPIEKYIGVGECAQGQVKALHPRIFAGILNKKKIKPENELECLEDGKSIFPINYVVVQPYPFYKQLLIAKEQGNNKNNESFEKLLKYIDIGGISLLRAAAKNYESTYPLYEKEDCDTLAEILNAKNNNDINDKKLNKSCEELKSILATKVFQLTSLYDAVIADWMGIVANDILPAQRNSFAKRSLMLRYGENPHQSAALYTRIFAEKSPTQLQTKSPMLCGRSPSYNNLFDVHKATTAVVSQEKPSCAIVKHGNLSGFACAENIEEAFQLAYRCDTLSAYGGVIAVNRTCNESLFQKTNKKFLTIISAPSFADNALDIVSKNNNNHPMLLPYPRLALEIKSNFEVRSMGKHVRILQSPNNVRLKIGDISQKGEKVPSEKEKKAMLFAFDAVALMTSNAIAIVHTEAQATIGLGCGQTSRIDAVHIAIHKAQREGHDLMGSIVASDGFIPFPDALAVLAQAGVRAILHPGGGKNEKTIIDLANKLGIVICSTGGLRAFSH